MDKTAIIHFDGASKGNPGPSGWGFVVREELDGPIIYRGSGGVPSATNNEMEYDALIGALTWAQGNGYTGVDVYGDSALVCNQVAGKWKIKAQNLFSRYKVATDLYNSFEKRSLTYIPRAQNKDADRLASDAAMEISFSTV